MCRHSLAQHGIKVYAFDTFIFLSQYARIYVQIGNNVINDLNNLFYKDEKGDLKCV